MKIEQIFIDCEWLSSLLFQINFQPSGSQKAPHHPHGILEDVWMTSLQQYIIILFDDVFDGLIFGAGVLLLPGALEDGPCELVTKRKVFRFSISLLLSQRPLVWASLLCRSPFSSKLLHKLSTHAHNMYYLKSIAQILTTTGLSLGILFHRRISLI